MTNNQFLYECKFLTNEVMRFKHDDLEKSIDRAMLVLKGKRTKQMSKDNPLLDDIFNHYSKQYRPLVRWMVIALDNKENFK
jgi:hypothetical protein